MTNERRRHGHHQGTGGDRLRDNRGTGQSCSDRRHGL